MSSDPVPKLIAILGPTASGKTAVANKIAVDLDAMLVNADAFQVYRGFDIGTAKPPNKHDYRLIDVLEPDVPFSVGDFVVRAVHILEEAWSSRKNVVLVGGTGLYVRALLEEYGDLHGPADKKLRQDLEEREHADGLGSLVKQLYSLNPEAANSIDLKNPVRVRRALERALSPAQKLEFKLPPFQVRRLALNPETGLLNDRIHDRVHEMMQNGWIQEVRLLKELGVSLSYPAMRAIGYRTIWRVLEGGFEEQEAESRIVAETTQYAKRQRTWLRTEPNILEYRGFGSSEEAYGLATELVN